MVVSSDPYVTDDDFKEFLAATTFQHQYDENKGE